MAKMKTNRVLINGKRRGFFADVGKLKIKTTAPENLNVFFPSVNLGFG